MKKINQNEVPEPPNYYNVVKKEQNFLLFMILGLLLINLGMGLYFKVNFDQMEEHYKIELGLLNATETFGENHFNGFYSSNGYYCVITANRDFADVVSTDVHEQCHALIDDSPNHFCDEVWK